MMLAAVAVGLALAASPGARTVGCDEAIAAAPVRGRLVLAAAVVPPVHISQSSPTESMPWTYFSKWGLVIRAGAGADVSVTVPPAWRQRVAISWGRNQQRAFHTLRFPRCAGDAAHGSVYAGGFFLRRAADCVPLRFRLGKHTRLVWFGIVKRCG